MFEQVGLIITLPFMQRAIIGGILVGVITSWMGVLVVLRKSSFFGDAIAHSSLTGVALGLLLGINPILAAAFYAIGIAFVLPYLEKHSELPVDSLLGFILPFSMGIGVILLSVLPGYQPELISFLFGSILAISWIDVLVILAIAFLILFVMIFLRKKLIFSSFDEEYAKISGINTKFTNSIYQVLLAITIVAGIRLVGIVLVNALLVIPASTVRLFARSLKDVFVFTPILAVVIVLSGLILSYFVNWPSGPTVAVVSGGIFLLGVIVRKI